MHPVDAIFYWAKHHPHRLAVVLPSMAITYQAMAEAIDAVCERIERTEFDRRRPVAVAIGDPGKLLVICFALLRQGITCAPVSATAVKYLAANGIEVLVGSGEIEIEDGRNIRFDDSWLSKTALASSPKPERSEPAAYGDLIFFTSGTTGTPKKIIMSSDALIDRANLVTVTGEAIHNRILILPGLGSGFGFNRAVPVLYAGKTACFAYGAHTQLRFINTFDVDVIVASVQQASDLVEVVEQGPKYRSESLKEVWISGGFASPSLVRRIQTSLCRTVRIVYGSSESGFIASASYDLISHLPQAVGFVVPGTQIEIVDSDGLRIPTGEEGIVRGRSDYIAKIFAANHPDESEVAGEAWWYPGDRGRLTPDGVLCITGRIDDVINVGGVKIAASLLDEVACSHPGVSDAAVCTVANSSGIEEIWIGIVAAGQIDSAGLRQSLEEAQGDRIRVGEIIHVERIPRNDLGKLQRHELRTLLLQAKSRSV